MADPIATVIQIADRLIGLCKDYLTTVKDAPSDLRTILIETSTLKVVFESLQFLLDSNSAPSDVLAGLSSENGPVQGCQRSVSELEKLFPPKSSIVRKGQSSKKQKLTNTLAILAWPGKQDRAKKLLDEISRYKSTITLTLSADSTRDLKDVKRKTEVIQQSTVYNWLRHTDPSPIHNQASGLYEPETGDWMLRSTEWTDWLTGKLRCLWIHGIPGAGKTILVSHLNKCLQQHCKGSTNVRHASVYYYCYFGHNQDESVPFLQWLLCQLCRQANFIPDIVYQMHQQGKEPSHPEFLSALAATLDSFDTVYITIDAVDESKPRDVLLQILRDFVTDSRFRKIQLLVTSRLYIDIERVLEPLSKSVSMSNDLVTQDIRRFVQSKLQSNPKFRQWPKVLIHETVDALVVGAKGIFRWAVCQIHELQRLKCERNIIKGALANLPKDLDETYERIFSSIPRDDWKFVDHVFKWMYFDNELDIPGKPGIPCKVLLQAIERSIAVHDNFSKSRLYDAEVLRELCGCLINVVVEEDSRLRVSFAHYTVLEFLESPRVTEGLAADFAISKDAIPSEMIKIILCEALNIQPNEILELANSPAPVTDEDVWDVIEAGFNYYSIGSAVFSLLRWPSTISGRSDLSELLFTLLNPSEPHFDLLRDALSLIGQYNYSNIFSDVDYFDSQKFWEITFYGSPDIPESAIVLFLLLLPLEEQGEHFRLAEQLLNTKNKRRILQSTLAFEKPVYHELRGGGEVSGTYIFRGTFVEIGAQFALISGTFREELNFLLGNAEGLFDPTNILLLSSGSYTYSWEDSGESSREVNELLDRMLKLGGDPNPKGKWVTPLQMATASWHLGGVRLLLEAGANPNDTGDKQGAKWEEGSLLGIFNNLHGSSPLVICREFECTCKDWAKDKQELRWKIDALLCEYGAKEFRQIDADTSNSVWWDTWPGKERSAI